MRDEMARYIQAGNLPDSVDDLALRRLFEAHGAVRSAVISRHVESGRSAGAGFVEMESEEGGTAAIAALHHLEYGGRVLSVCWSNPVLMNLIADRQRMFSSIA